MRIFIRFFTVFQICFASLVASAQESKIISWKNTVEKQGSGIYKIIFTGSIQKGWHIYTAPDAALELSGITISGDDSTVILRESKIENPGSVPNDPVFAKNLQKQENSITFIQNIQLQAAIPASLELAINYEVGSKESFFPESDTQTIITGEKGLAAAAGNRLLIASINTDKPLTDAKTSSSNAAERAASGGLFSIFIIGFLGGLVALLTPCVFPMIPLTVSFFTKKPKQENLVLKMPFSMAFLFF